MALTTLLSDLTGKRALITGGSSGIGAATARLLAACGVNVAVGYRTRAADADEVAAQARNLGVSAFTFAADISSSSGAERLVDRAVDSMGGLDIFVGNAGIWPSAEVPVESMESERWTDTVRENLDSIFYTTRAADGVIETSGRIVLVSSTAGPRGEI